LLPLIDEITGFAKNLHIVLFALTYYNNEDLDMHLSIDIFIYSIGKKSGNNSLQAIYNRNKKSVYSEAEKHQH
tara:strand:- start:124 stop:342 length:219 start_codon:yes stop_codon:yes gene_type:complete